MPLFPQHSQPGVHVAWLHQQAHSNTSQHQITPHPKHTLHPEPDPMPVLANASPVKPDLVCAGQSVMAGQDHASLLYSEWQTSQVTYLAVLLFRVAAHGQPGFEGAQPSSAGYGEMTDALPTHHLLERMTDMGACRDSGCRIVEVLCNYKDRLLFHRKWRRDNPKGLGLRLYPPPVVTL